MAKKSGTAIVWFRRDLRLLDNPAMQEAAEYELVIPLYIHTPSAAWLPKVGEASQWWLHESLAALGIELKALGSGLIFESGDPLTVLSRLVREYDVKAVFWNKLYEPSIYDYDKKLFLQLKEQNVMPWAFASYLLVEPSSMLKKDATPYVVYTAFFNAAMRTFADPKAVERPEIRPLPKKTLSGQSLEQLQIKPKLSWIEGLASAWQPGERHALASLERFLDEGLSNYLDGRNVPGIVGTSRLSPYLHFGEISPARVLNAIYRHPHKATTSEQQYVKEIFWREFALYLLFHFPKTESEPLRPEFLNFPWAEASDLLRLWQKGLTGFPIVDAGMRELWQTGWMHNRVRMIVASFLVKDLLIPWQTGAAWFWDTLVDASLPNNTLGWQWTAGCGADAAPYFRIFNPVLQGEKFDPTGAYIRHWCPELAKLPNKWIHKPWQAGPMDLKSAGVQLGRDYPEPMIDHGYARERALAAYQQCRGKKSMK